MKVTPGNAQYQGERKDQQDTCWISRMDDQAFIQHGGILAIVADGMGGLANGAEASRLATTTFSNGYLSKPVEQSVRDALDEAVEIANQAVYARSVDIGERGNFGTTLVAAAVTTEGLYWISVGDSRLYLLRQGELTQVSLDHSEGHYLTSYIGDRRIDEIDRNLRPFPLESGDWLLLCSDGLHGFMSHEAILAQLKDHPQDAADRLIERIKALKHPRQDNTTVVILKYEMSGSVQPPKKSLLHRWLPKVGKPKQPQKRRVVSPFRAALLAVRIVIVLGSVAWGMSRWGLLEIPELKGIPWLPHDKPTTGTMFSVNYLAAKNNIFSETLQNVLRNEAHRWLLDRYASLRRHIL